jgi:hypothetical protein
MAELRGQCEFVNPRHLERCTHKVVVGSVYCSQHKLSQKKKEERAKKAEIKEREQDRIAALNDKRLELEKLYEEVWLPVLDQKITALVEDTDQRVADLESAIAKLQTGLKASIVQERQKFRIERDAEVSHKITEWLNGNMRVTIYPLLHNHEYSFGPESPPKRAERDPPPPAKRRRTTATITELDSDDDNVHNPPRRNPRSPPKRVERSPPPPVKKRRATTAQVEEADLAAEEAYLQELDGKMQGLGIRVFGDDEAMEDNRDEDEMSGQE